ncbi:MAG: hypothetical protein WC374_13160 [Phycisphaerae bacterium]|jgi:hypothetical protein
MGDMNDDFKFLDDMKKERHTQWHAENLRIIAESKIPCTAKSEVVLFRESGKPKVDFYPSTGRWKVGNQIYSGGAQSFLNWYNKQ